MTTTSVTGINAITTGTDTWFRSIKVLSDMLTTLGFVKTTDTGQIDWTTVTMPASTVMAGYEIRKLSDTYQTTDPLFMKISYSRTTASSQSSPLVQIELGTGSNGSGTLTGSQGTPQLCILTTVTSGSTDWVGSTDGSGVALILGANQNLRCCLLIERLRGADGEPLVGQTVLWKNMGTAAVAPGASDIVTLHYDWTSGYAEQVGGAPVSLMTGLSDPSLTLNVLKSFKYPFGTLSWPTSAGKGYSLLMVGYAYVDFLHGTEFDITRFTDNQVCHYRCHKSTNIPAMFGGFDAQSNVGSFGAIGRWCIPAIWWA